MQLIQGVDSCLQSQTICGGAKSAQLADEQDQSLGSCSSVLYQGHDLHNIGNTSGIWLHDGWVHQVYMQVSSCATSIWLCYHQQQASQAYLLGDL